MFLNINESLSFNIPNYIGTDSIKGRLLKKDNSILKYNRVRLYNQKNGGLIFELLSDIDGFYNFDKINFKKGPFFVVSHDPAGQHNGVIADNIGGVDHVDN